ncbi:uncharacterized protein BDZ99DRAFT_410483, partial [Mytilinidion resinicola]
MATPQSIIGIFPTPGEIGQFDLVYTEDGDNGIPHIKTQPATSLTEEEQKKYAFNALPFQNVHTHIIISTASGTGLASTFFTQALQPLLAHMGLEETKNYTLHTTASISTVTDLTTTLFLPTAASGTPQRLILLSGDGGLLDILNALLSTPSSPTFKPPTIILLPLGTGNALAHSTLPAGDATHGLSALARGTPHPLPFFVARFSPGARLLTNEARDSEPIPGGALYGAVVCSWGMHACLVGDSDTAAYRAHGAARFGMAAKEALFPADGGPPHAFKGLVSVRREGAGEWEALAPGRSEHMYVLATLVSNLEKTFRISPASSPLEARLRVVHFGPLGGDEVMRVMGLAYDGGKHVQEEAVGYEAVEGLRVEFKGLEEEGRWRRICVDGKIVRVESDGWVEV